MHRHIRLGDDDDDDDDDDEDDDDDDDRDAAWIDGAGCFQRDWAAAEPTALWSCVLSSGQGAGRPGNCELLSLPHLTAYCSQAGSTKMRQLGDNPDQSNAASY